MNEGYGMTDKELTNNGYQPTLERLEKGYQPVLDAPFRPHPRSGYQPRSSGDNPTSVPVPPKER